MRRFSMLVGVLFCTLTPTLHILGQTTPSSPVEVAYVLTAAGIEVYDVDRQTGRPIFEGLATVPITFYSVIPSPDDHFVYVYGSKAIFGREYLDVYATDSTGMLQEPAIQEFEFPTGAGVNFLFDPKGTFGYAVVSRQDSNGETSAGILLFTFDPTTGRLIGSPKVIASYPPNGPCGSGWSVVGSFGLVGFSPGGNSLNDAWTCNEFRSSNTIFYRRSVDQQTGALGPDVPTLGASSITGGPYSEVNFTPHVILDDFISADYFENTVYVYPLGGGITPLFTCGTAMLTLCGQSFGETVEPSGEYIFFSTLSGSTEITKLDLQAKQIVDTGNSLPDGVWAFSPDSALIYTSNSYTSPWVFPIYTFDLATGGATQGGQIVVQKSSLVLLVPALRK